MSGRAPWIPDDDELDTVARSVEPAQPTMEQAEQNRTRVLAMRGSIRQQPKRSATPLIVTASFSMAAAAAVIVWLVVRPPPTDPRAASPKQVIAALTPSRFERVSDWPDFVVRIDDGKVAIQVASLAVGERFRVKTADAELEVRGTHFIVEVDNGRLASVIVDEGWVELRKPSEAAVDIRAGGTWHRTQTAEALPIEKRAVAPTEAGSAATPAVAAITNAPAAEQSTAAQPATRTTTSTKIASSTTKASSPTTKPEAAPTKPAQPAITTVAPVGPPVPPVSSSNPGEADFRAGWSALRAGKAAEAAKSFTAACTAAQSDALGEDACFWTGVAAKRAGQNSAAKEALGRFLRRFPSSARASEASALLGWALYDAGDLAGAEPYFRRAANDRVPKVRDSAQKGLTAIERRTKK